MRLLEFFQNVCFWKFIKIIKDVNYCVRSITSYVGSDGTNY